MREKLNDNPLAQAAIVGVLLIAAFVFFLGGKGGEEEEGSAEPAGGSVAVAAPAEAGSPTDLPAPSTGVGAPPPLPGAVTSAFAAGDTIVLLFVRDGGIDDRRVTRAVDSVSSTPGVATFVVPAERIARYAAIAQGADVNRVPALVVVSPKRVDAAIPKASVHYGYQSPESVEQAVIDAGYKGRTLPYHP
ncbi:MAG: hypothetical protein ACJ75S_10215 [Solirubrobacterales bacterium]